MWLYNSIINNMLIIIISVLGIILKIHSQEIGEKCRLKENQEHYSEGICKLHSDCREIENYAKKMIPITLCGFHHLTVPIVCCKKNNRSESIIFPFQEEEAEEETFDQENDESTIISSRKSEEMCNQYTKIVTDTVHAIPLITDVKPISINVTKCEYNSVALIVGGTPALIGEFPFMVAVGFPNSENQQQPEWRCGGTLISDKWVLTAAHCTFSRDGAPKWLRFGALNLNRRYESGRVDYFIDRIIVHPKYKYPLKYNDIALLSTSESVEFSNLIRPACLNTKFNVNKQKVALAVGWGQTDYSGPNSEKLLKVQLNIYNNNVCTNAYHQDITGNSQISKGILSSMLCAGELKGGRDTCLGDSGGPLFITETNNRCKFFIIGVTSFGKLCGQENVPAVYTRVSEYVPWIESIIW